jgi:hypothetical protein
LTKKIKIVKLALKLLKEDEMNQEKRLEEFCLKNKICLLDREKGHIVSLLFFSAIPNKKEVRLIKSYELYILRHQTSYLTREQRKAVMTMEFREIPHLNFLSFQTRVITKGDPRGIRSKKGGWYKEYVIQKSYRYWPHTDAIKPQPTCSLVEIFDHIEELNHHSKKWNEWKKEHPKIFR